MRAPHSVLLALVLALLTASGAAVAQEEAQGNTYITPFPENDLYRMQVVGDTLAEGRVGWNDHVQMINQIIRERAYVNGVKYVDAYEGFVDDIGNFNPYGPDLTGKMRILREPDGVHFTPAGNRKLAHFVEREIRRDLTQAK